jgi:xylan 1,4-beta-xylosidase
MVKAMFGLGLAIGTGVLSRADESIRFAVDFARTNGVLRALHGVNKGPIAAGGTIDLSEQHRELGVPFTRLHDCLWPHPDVVDIHAIFRNPAADPEFARSYDFALTDEYLAAVHRTGAKIVYRLGESIEHMATKRFVHPPADIEKWAAIGVGIIRHYNEGWANGYHYRIPYVEIWNEPENRPAMWSGTDEDFLKLYATAAKRIKNEFPKLKVGGPGFGATGRLKDAALQPTEFLLSFLKHCKAEKVPLDFLSWHCYTADVGELVTRAREIRKLLDAEGFGGTESHLNEWNYLPDNSWDPFGKAVAASTRRQFYGRAQGREGASFALASLIQLQDASVDVANFFHGEIGGFGMFDEFGGETEVFRAFKLFNAVFRRTPIRVPITAKATNEVAIMACRNEEGTVVSIIFSNPTDQPQKIEMWVANLPTKGELEVTLICGKNGGESPLEMSGNRLSIRMDRHSCGMIRFGSEIKEP